MGTKRISKLFTAILFLSFLTAFILPVAGNETTSRVLKTSNDLWINNKKATEISSIALREAGHFLKQAYNTDITQMDLIQHIESIMYAEGADPALSFAPIVYSGDNHLSLHADPLDDFTHVIDPESEPVVTIDLGAKYQGQCSDVTRTYFFDSATQEMHDAYQDVLDTHHALLGAMHEGVAISDLDIIYRSQLADYIASDDAYVHLNWGHGVGDHVHEYPTLNNRTDAVLTEGMILAVEPNIFFFNEGWSVRVEDTVKVTTDGVEIFSDIPVEIENVTISPDSEPVTVSITNDNYFYDEVASVQVIIDNQTHPVSNVSYHDGYNWSLMEKVNDTLFEHDYLLDYSFSGLITTIVKVVLGNETVYYTEEFEMEPSQYIPVENQLSLTGSNTSEMLEWEINVTGSTMIRVHFDDVISPEWDQLVIMEETGKIIYDFRDRGYLTDIWSPWISGSKMIINYYATSENWIDLFEFTIDKVEYIVLPEETTTTTDTTTDTGSTSSVETTTMDSVVNNAMIFVLIAIIYSLRKKR